MARGLADEGFLVFLLDLPAHGPHAGASTDVYELAEAIRIAGSAIGRIDLVVAHSLGALATVYAMAPEGEARPLDADSMGLVAPGTSPDHAMTRFAADVGMPPAIEAGVRSEMERRFGQDVWTRAPAMVRYVDMVGRSLVVHDREDDRVPHEFGAALATDVGARLLTTSGLGHNRPLRDPEVIAGVVSFALELVVENEAS